MKEEKVTGETPIQEDPMNSMPVLVEAFADNGEFSHWRLVDRQTSELLWTECPEEDAILYTGFKVQEHKPESEETTYTFKEMIGFVKWYSGMSQEKVVNAYNRYLVENKDLK